MKFKIALSVIALYLTHGAAFSEEISFSYKSFFDSFHSATFVAEVFGQAGEKYNPDPNPMVKIADIKYGINGSKVFFDYVQRNETGEVTNSERYTYDGRTSSIFIRNNIPTLATYNTKRVSGIAIEGKNVLLEPFSFIWGKRYTSQGPILTLGDLSKPAEWNNLEKAAVFLKEESLDGRDCVVIELACGSYPNTTRPYVVQAWLDKEMGNYPIQWKRVYKTGAPINKYKIIEIGWLDSDKKIPFPKISEYQCFDEAGDLYSNSQIKVVNSSFNQNIANEEFFVEPRLADRIYDGDSGVWIASDRKRK